MKWAAYIAVVLSIISVLVIYRRDIQSFSGYVRRYFTHYTLFQLDKNSGIIKPGQWYSITITLKIDKGETIWADSIYLFDRKLTKNEINSLNQQVQKETL